MTTLAAHNADHERTMHERFLLGRIATANYESSLTDLQAVRNRYGDVCYYTTPREIADFMDTLAAAGPEPDAEELAATDAGIEAAIDELGIARDDDEGRDR